MKPFRMMITTLLLLLPAISFSQITNDPATKIVGKWLLVKHTLTENGKTEDLLTPNDVHTYVFSQNGTYEVSFVNNKNASTTIYKGKWKITGKGTKLKLYESTLPSDPKQLVGDKTFPIIRMTPTVLVIKELLFGMDLLGTSTYKKQ